MINPIAFSIGNLDVRWYGILMALAYVVGYFISLKLAEKKGIKKETVEDFYVWLIISAVIGARALHVIDDWHLYKDNFISIFYIWNGGLAFFGGLIGVAIAGKLFAKKKGIDFYGIADLFVIPLALGLAIGRVGNFINQELYGKVTNLPWGINFEGVEGKRHPSQLYGVVKDLFIFFVLLNNYKKENIKSGFIFWSFVTLYSGIRFFLDIMKERAIWFLGLSHAQVYTIIAFIIGIYMLRKINRS